MNDNATLYRIVHPWKANYTLCLRKKEYVDETIRKAGSWSECNPFFDFADKAKGLYVDVGTNIGACSLPMYANGYRVLSFEPTASTFAALEAAVKATQENRQSIEMRGEIRLIKKGLSDERGQSIIYSRPGNSGDSISRPVHQKANDPVADSFWKSGTGYLAKPTRKNKTDVFIQSTIELTTLDDEVTEPVDFMKIDAQGHEVKVLQGAEKLLRKIGVNKILFEWSPWSWARFGHNETEILTFLHERGYLIYPGHAMDQLLGPPIDPANFWTYADFRPKGNRRTDFLAIKKGVELPVVRAARAKRELAKLQQLDLKGKAPKGKAPKKQKEKRTSKSILD